MPASKLGGEDGGYNMAMAGGSSVRVRTKTLLFPAAKKPQHLHREVNEELLTTFSSFFQHTVTG